MIQVSKHKRKQYFVLFTLIFLGLALVMYFIYLSFQRNPSLQSPESTNSSISGSANIASSTVAVVNKGRSLPAGYKPIDLTVPTVALRQPASDPEMQVRTEVAPSLENLLNEAKKQNLNLMLVSGYRSYELQSQVYSEIAANDGVDSADKVSARPGHSEHQTGLAADVGLVSRVCELQGCFADTAEGKWLAKNAYKYGFIIRYQKDKTELTGYAFEPWHLRYVGQKVANQMNSSNQTLEQYLYLPSFADYSKKPFVLKNY